MRALSPFLAPATESCGDVRGTASAGAGVRLLTLSVAAVAGFETTTDAEGHAQFTISGVFGAGYTVYALTADPGGALRPLFAGVSTGQVIYIAHDCAARSGSAIVLLNGYPAGGFALAYGTVDQFLAYNCVPGTPYNACSLLAVGAPAAVATR